jgi:hypothetical protein
MMPFLTWLEQTGFSVWVRESPSMFAYPMILFLHTAGLAFLVGPSVVIGARILGFPKSLPLAPLEKFYPIMWIGFWINAVSGVVLLVADATTEFTNWDFYVKLAFIVIAVIALQMLRGRAFHHAAATGPDLPAMASRTLATLVLISWFGAIFAGRLMAYLGPVSGAPLLNNKL